MTIYVGIDPGQKGGIAMLKAYPGDDRPELVAWLKMQAVGPTKTEFPLIKEGMPDIALISRWLVENDFFLENNRLAIEQVNGLRGQSASASFNFGRDTGMLISGLAPKFGHGSQYHKMRWGPNVGLPIGAKKIQSVNLALSLWPDAPERGKGKFTDGPAEACLIAYYDFLRFTGKV